MNEVRAQTLIDRQVSQAIATDLRTLARFHDREPNEELLERLRSVPLSDWISLQLRSEAGVTAVALVEDALAAMPHPVDQDTLDELAVDYANIYLTYGYRVSPTESVWVDHEGLDRQGPMFSVRGFYRRYGLEAEKWQSRPDDHLVLQLEFLGHLFEALESDDTLADAMRFLDHHILVWIGAFAQRVGDRAATQFFPGLALLTAAYLEELRQLLFAVTGEERRTLDIEAIYQKRQDDERERENPPAFAPGQGPGW